MGHWTVVFHHALDRLPRQVQAVELGIALFQLGHDAEGLDVVIEAAIRLHLHLQLVLARMAERRMPQIVGQGDGLGQILIQPQRMGQRPRDLRHLQTVGQAGAIMVALMSHEHLRLALQPTEGGRVDDAVTVARKGVASAARRLRHDAAQRVPRGLGIGREAACGGEWTGRRRLLAQAGRVS